MRIYCSWWLITIIAALHHYDVSADNRVLCPADSSLIGYTSIERLNADVAAELEAIQSQTKVMEDSYQFTLCPYTTFLVPPQSPLLVTLNNTNILCGRYGNIDDECTVTGGYNQVMLADSPSTSLKYASFRGITFSYSEYVSVAAFANAAANAEFYNCAWTYNTGGASIFIRPKSSSTSHTTTIQQSTSGFRHQTAAVSTSSRNGGQHRQRDLWQLDDPSFAAHANNQHHRRRDQQMPQAMSVRLFDCNITNGLINTTYGKIFSAVYSAGGVLQMDHVQVNDNHGTLLFNLVNGGKAVVTNSTFSNNVVDAIWRPIYSSLLQLDQVSFVNNHAEGIVVAIGNSQANVKETLFDNNHVNQGSAIMILEQSQLQLYDSCLLQGTTTTTHTTMNTTTISLAGVFVDSSSQFFSDRNFANVQGEYCHSNGTGILVEASGHDCLRNDCVGTCQPYGLSECPLTIPPGEELTNTPPTEKVSSNLSLSSSSNRHVVGVTTTTSWGIVLVIWMSWQL